MINNISLKNYFLDNILEVRNIVAHNNRVLDFKCRKNTLYIQVLHSKYNLTNNAPRQDIYNIFLILQCLLSKNQYAQLHNTVLKRINVLNKKLNTISSNKILDSLGFPNDWHDTQKLPQ